VSWKVNREIVVVLGWPAAILMQLAHPLVLAGVLDHSVFVADPTRRWERLRSTVESMLLLTFGSPRQVQQTADKINAIHDYVHGRLDRCQGIFRAGTEYTAHDPELLRWVHATLLDVIPRAYEAFVGHLTPEEKDRYCQEATCLGPLLGMPADYLPASMSELRAYMGGMYASGVIDVTDRARWMASEILTPNAPLPPWRALAWLNTLPTLALLPPGLRQAYGLPWGTLEQSAVRAGTTLARRIVPRIPALMRHWPASRRPMLDYAR
ncbi:MAG TPA: oxygenase MpaB family protein, partial [Chloroflexota bacterium]